MAGYIGESNDISMIHEGVGDRVEEQYNEIFGIFFNIVGQYYASLRRKFRMNPKKVQLGMVQTELKTLESLVRINDNDLSMRISELNEKMKRFLENPRKYG